ncbi:unnamed protein product [Alopecurus aequalis]
MKAEQVQSISYVSLASPKSPQLRASATPLAMPSSSSLLLSLVLLLAASSTAWGMGWPHGRPLTHIHMYMQEIAGPNGTAFVAAPSRQGGDTTFGMVEVLDNELRDGPDPSNSSLLGRFQGVGAYAGLVTPPGLTSVISFVFTSGKYNGSMLFMVGTILSFELPFERAIVGGIGKFRMARGYSIVQYVGNPTPLSSVYEVDLYVEGDA